MRQLILSLLVVGGAVGLAGWRLRQRSAVVVSPRDAPRVLIYADLREADSPCTCGELIRAVRAARARGVPVQEIGSGDPGPAVQAHRLLVSPTVLFLAPNGTEQYRFEGEGEDALAGTRRLLAESKAHP